MKRLSLLLWVFSFYSCSNLNSNKNTPAPVSAPASGATRNQYATSDIDTLIAQHEQDMEQDSNEHQAFRRVLQSLKDGTMDINDAFFRSGANGGEKCDKRYEWDTHSGSDKPAEWQTFLIHIVEFGSTPGNHIPYFEYAKANNADFKIWDMYGRSLLHLVLAFHTQCAAADLAWLLENIEAKELINEPLREMGNPVVLRNGTAPWSTEPALQAILRKHGSTHSG